MKIIETWDRIRPSSRAKLVTQGFECQKLLSMRLCVVPLCSQ